MQVALAEQELIQEGLRRHEIKRLCDVHPEVMKKQLNIEDCFRYLNSSI